MDKKTPVYGLTGNIGCGKSTVAKFFGEFNDVAVIDADKIAKELLNKEENHGEIKRLFGPEVFTDGQPDTKKIGRLVFSDRAALMKLENFIHPLVRQKVAELTRPRPEISFFIVEATLIFETDWQDLKIRRETANGFCWQKFFDAIIVVTCSETEQYRRLRETRNMTDEEIAKRLRWQMPDREKIRRADYSINTDCPIEETKRRTRNLYCRLKNKILKNL